MRKILYNSISSYVVVLNSIGTWLNLQSSSVALFLQTELTYFQNLIEA